MINLADRLASNNNTAIIAYSSATYFEVGTLLATKLSSEYPAVIGNVEVPAEQKLGRFVSWNDDTVPSATRASLRESLATKHSKDSNLFLIDDAKEDYKLYQNRARLMTYNLGSIIKPLLDLSPKSGSLRVARLVREQEYRIGLRRSPEGEYAIKAAKLFIAPPHKVDDATYLIEEVAEFLDYEVMSAHDIKNQAPSEHERQAL